MAKRPTVLDKLLARIDARIAALKLAREELLLLGFDERDERLDTVGGEPTTGKLDAPAS